MHDDAKAALRYRHGLAIAATIAMALAACAPPNDSAQPALTTQPTVSHDAPTSRSEPPPSFPAEAFDAIGDDPVPREVAKEFQASLNDMAGGGGMAATVLSPDGTWSGATGTADGARDVRVDDQFAIGSVTKSVIAAQVMQMVEAGELALDDPADDHLPAGVDFDTNGATIRHLLGMHSGIPDYWPELRQSLSTNRQRVWKMDEMLGLVPADRAPAGEAFEYSNTNYLLLELVINQVRRRDVVEVLRNGVLRVEGTERLIYQPDEVPTKPMAMPNGESTVALKKGAGYLPSLASATAGPTTGAMASDSLSLARWWRAFCAGEIVSPTSLTEMATFRDGYGLGLYDPAAPYAISVGHTGEDIGFVAWAGCLPESGSVVVVLHNRVVEDIGGMARPLVAAAIQSRE